MAAYEEVYITVVVDDPVERLGPKGNSFALAV
jgi:hypothetical protein